MRLSCHRTAGPRPLVSTPWAGLLVAGISLRRLPHGGTFNGEMRQAGRTPALTSLISICMLGSSLYRYRVCPVTPKVPRNGDSGLWLVTGTPTAIRSTPATSPVTLAPGRSHNFVPETKMHLSRQVPSGQPPARVKMSPISPISYILYVSGGGGEHPFPLLY